MLLTQTRFLDVFIAQYLDEGESDCKAVVSLSWYPAAIEWDLSSQPHW